MECIRHRALEGSTGVLQTERELFVSESAPQTDKGGFVLISWRDINLVITRETVHKRVYLTSGTLINELVNEGCGVVILGTGSINITVINTDPDGTLLFIHRDDIGNPICEWDGVDKTSLEKLFNFRFNGCSLSGVHGA